MVLSRSLLLLFTIALAKAQDDYSREGPGYDSYYRGGRVLNPDDALNDVVYGDEIPGEPGIDYPVLTEVPRTGFNCGLQPYPGYYADPAASCQVFYVCTGSGRGTGFLCPNGTIFNQESLVCDWWYNFDCNTAVSLYRVNAEIARAMAAVDAATAAARARGLGVLPPGRFSAGRLAGAGGRAPGAFGLGRAGALAGRRRPLTTPGRSPRPVYGAPAAGGNRNNVAGGGRNDFGRGYNNAPSPVYGAPGGNYNQNNDAYNNYNRPSSASGGNYNQNDAYNNYNRPSSASGGNYNQNDAYNNYNRPSSASGGNYNQNNDAYNNYNRPSSASGGNYNQNNDAYNNYNRPSSASGGNYNQNNDAYNNYNRPSSASGGNYNQNNDAYNNYNRPSNAPGGNYNQNNDGYNYNRPSSSGGPGFGGPSSSYGPPSSGGYETPAGQQGTSSPDRQYLPPY